MNPAQLATFKLVIWNNASGDVLNEAQRSAFKTWIEQGGSYLGRTAPAAIPSAAARDARR